MLQILTVHLAAASPFQIRSYSVAVEISNISTNQPGLDDQQYLPVVFPPVELPFTLPTESLLLLAIEASAWMVNGFTDCGRALAYSFIVRTSAAAASDPFVGGEGVSPPCGFRSWVSKPIHAWILG